MVGFKLETPETNVLPFREVFGLDRDYIVSHVL